MRAVAAAEGLEADDEAVDAELEQAVLAAAPGAGQDAAAEVDAAAEAARLRDALASSGRLSDMRSQISKRAALEWITERVELVDPDGEVVDPELLSLPADVGDATENPQDVAADQDPAPEQDEGAEHPQDDT